MWRKLPDSRAEKEAQDPVTSLAVVVFVGPDCLLHFTVCCRDLENMLGQRNEMPGNLLHAHGCSSALVNEEDGGLLPNARAFHPLLH